MESFRKKKIPKEVEKKFVKENWRFHLINYQKFTTTELFDIDHESSASSSFRPSSFSFRNQIETHFKILYFFFVSKLFIFISKYFDFVSKCFVFFHVH